MRRLPQRGPAAALRPRSLLPALLALVAGSSAAGCKPPADAAEASGPTTGVKERELPVVRTASVEARDMVRVLEATSKLESDRAVPLFPELNGVAVEILVEEGDEVTQGQVLARLDARDEQLAKRDAIVSLQEAKDGHAVAELAVEEATRQLEKAAAAARQAERDYDRDEELARTTTGANPLSEQAVEARRLERDQRRNDEDLAEITLRRRGIELQNALTAIARAEVALERAERNLEKKEIRAPFDGVIAQRNIRIGNSMGTAEAAFVLTDTAHVRATFMRPQEELALFAELRAGSPTGIGADEGSLTLAATAEAYPGRRFEGWIERISPTIEAESGQFRVVARLRPAKDDPGAAVDGGLNGDAHEARLLPGMLIRMEIVTDRHVDALSVPKRALRREGERRFLLVVEDAGAGGDERVLRRVDVDEGYEDDEYVEVLPREAGRLSLGDVVVSVGTRELEDGDPVRVLDLPGAGAEPEATEDELVELDSIADDTAE